MRIGPLHVEVQTPIQPIQAAKPSWSVVAREDKTLGPLAELILAKRAGSKITEIDGSHFVYASKPAVARLIEGAATVAPPRT